MPVNLSTNARLTRRQKALRLPSAGGEWTVRPPVREFRSRCTTALIPTAENSRILQGRATRPRTEAASESDRLLPGPDYAEEAVRFVENTGSKINAPPAKAMQRPKSVHHQRCVIGFEHRAEFGSGIDVIAMNQAVSKITDEQGPAKSTEISRCQSESPG